tara:strand:- start:1579 stop:1830 length:252 start_codon:yes stop_codon:yes gene_type:complete
MKSINPKNEYIPLSVNISVRRDTLRLLSEIAEDMGVSISEVLSFLAEDSVIDFELDEELFFTKIPNKCSFEDLKEALIRRRNI